MPTENFDENTLAAMMGSLAAAFTKERKQTGPYKEMFKAGSSLTGLLRHLESEMTSHVLDACDAHKERNGVGFSTDQFNVLMALSLLVKMATKDAEREGSACSVDKAYFILSEQLLALDGPTLRSE